MATSTLRWAASHWGSALVAAFLAYMAWSLHTLYTVAVPKIPPIVDERGNVLRHLRPLWSEARAGLDFRLTLSTSNIWKVDVPELHVLHLGADSALARAANLSYGFGDASSLELDAGFSLLRDGDVNGVVAACSEHAGDNIGSGAGGDCNSIGIGPPIGLQVWCQPAAGASSTDAGASSDDLCVRLHATVQAALASQRAADAGAASALAAATPAPATTTSSSSGLSSWMRYHLGLAASDTHMPLATYYLDGVTRRSESVLPLPPQSSLAAVINALATGAPLHAHVTMAVASGSLTPPVYADVSQLQKPAQAYTGAASSSAKTRANRAKLRQQSPSLLHASTPLVVAREFKPVKPTRLLWRDPTGKHAALAAKRAGVYATLPVEPVSRTLLLPADGGKGAAGNPGVQIMMGGKPAGGSGASGGGGYNRAKLTTSTCRGSACSVAPALLAAADATGGDAPLSTAVATETHFVPSPGCEWPHWVGHLDVRLLMETAPIPVENTPPSLRPYLNVVSPDTVLPGVSGTSPAATSDDADGDASKPAGPRVVAKGVVGKYVPLLAVNPIRPLAERYHPLNHTVTHLPLRLSVSPSSIGHWQLLQVLQASIDTQESLGASEHDTDDLIRLFADTPAWLLLITLMVSVVHVAFDVLAIKNDVAFWSNTKSLRGISVRSLSIQLASQSIISVYLWHEGASLLVLVPQLALTALLAWKIAKAAGFVWGIKWVARVVPLPVPRHDAALAASAGEAHTSEYDRQALSFVLTLLTPIVVGFVLHSLIYQRHASWAEWALGTAVGAVYTFGFALMTPQLWINYRLKSVAQLPWRVLAYRFFNTIIDDLFGFIIRMPLMHRLSVFRDDVIFVIYIFQRWMYPVDSARPAEGFDADEDTTAASGPVEAAASGKAAPEAAASSQAAS